MSDFDVTAADSIDLDRLRRFVAVAEELHFARAAKALRIPRQALSATVIELEEELGTRVFVPGASPTQLSDDGAALLARARDLIRAREQAEREHKPDAPASLRVGFVPGVTVSKWARIWGERLPEHPLEIVGVAQGEQESVLREGRVDLCFVRLPIDRTTTSAIPLWQETPVAVVQKDDALSLLATISPADLADETIQDAADLDQAVDTLALVAAVGGAAIMPQSIARLHHRRDLVYRPVSDTEFTEIALAWPAGTDSELLEEFVGIVRGRSANSSRGGAEPQQRGEAPARKPAAKKPAVKKPAPKKPVARGRKPARRGR
ncbi:LysR family transcriptional regulator [Nocardia alba]|uniref:LysR substrate binding domain-containing protein n=1 Tax=Nocardia alba TaxID=225051 RepID=A0A4V2PBZ0_9NOCA|nr:LysR substrate-binding domain-containing protein [Nocardia alba]TCJ99175.1 LysR substrate binding domain-containing protein [Nocardia alba]